MDRFKTHRTIALMAAVAAINAWSTPVDESTAWAAASRFVQTRTIAGQSLPDRTATSIQARGSLWVVALSPSGHILVSGNDRATPIIGFSTNNFAEGDENSPERAALNAADAAVAKMDAANNQNKYWECYVLGLNPTNALDKFTATIRMEGQMPIVEFTPTNEVLQASGAIRYILQGKTSLTNDWTDCPSFDSPGDTNRFFRVKVEIQN